MVDARRACIHTYLERLQRQLVELEQALKEGPLSKSRTISTSVVVGFVVPKILFYVNVKILDSLEVFSQLVKCTVPLTFIVSHKDVNSEVYTS